MSVLDFDDDRGIITVRLNGLKRLVTMKSSVTLHDKDIRSVDVISPSQARKSMSMYNLTRLRGGKGKGRYYGGAFTKTATMEHEFWDVDDISKVVQVSMKRGPYARIFLSFDNPETSAAMIRERADNADRQ